MRVAMPKVNRDALANCWLWYPPRDEQECILRFIEIKRAPFDDSISRAEREIRLIHEYRTRIVTDVVTGQVDVREAAARLAMENLKSADVADLESEEEPDENGNLEEDDTP